MVSPLSPLVADIFMDTFENSSFKFQLSLVKYDGDAM